MDRRLRLQTILEEVLGNDNVYFQPPSNVEMRYPAIVYQRDSADTKFADNGPYSYTKRYQVTVISRDPESPIPDRMAALPMTTHERWFAADNLNHDVFTLYF